MRLDSERWHERREAVSQKPAGVVAKTKQTQHSANSLLGPFRVRGKDDNNKMSDQCGRGK